MRRDTSHESTQKKYLTRRQFAKLTAFAGLGMVLGSCGDQGPAPTSQETMAEAPTTAIRTPTAAAEPPIAAAENTTVASEIPTATANTPMPSEGSTPATTVPTPTAQAPTPVADSAYLAVARGPDPQAITRAALAGIGGIERFVRSGSSVIIKPNICTDYRTFEYGATTNPDVVATLVELCLSAGARRVRVMDTPFGGSAESAYAKSGIADAVESAGGKMEVMNRAKFRKTDIPEGRDITSWQVYQDLLTADVVINVPVAKHHHLTRLSLGGKNLLGVIQNPNQIHFNLGQRTADLMSVVRPTLTVVDAVRTLMAHGPTGGNLDDVRLTNTVIASHDIVAADAYAATLFDLTGADIPYVKAAADMGLGTLDLQSIRIQEVSA